MSRPVTWGGLIITPCSKGIYRDHAGAELSLVESVLRVCSDADEFCLAGSDGLDRSVWSALRWVGELPVRAQSWSLISKARLAEFESELHFHAFWIEPEAVAVFGYVANTRPWEVICEQRNLFVR